MEKAVFRRAEGHDGSTIPSSAVQWRKWYSVEKKAMLRKTFGTLAKKPIIARAEVASLLAKNPDVLAKTAKHHDMPMKIGKLIIKLTDVVHNLK